MIVTEAQINRLHRGGRVELDVDFRPTVGETYAAQLEKGLKRALDVSVIGAEKLEPGQWRVLVVKGSRVEKPLLLKARPGTDDYTERSGLAMPDEPEPIDPKARDAYAARARQAADEKRKAQRGAPGDLQIHIDAARRAERALFEELDERYVDWTPHQIAEHAPHQGNPAEIRERRRRHQRAGRARQRAGHRHRRPVHPRGGDRHRMRLEQLEEVARLREQALEPGEHVGNP